MTTRVVWFARRPPLPVQRQRLHELYPDCAVVHEPQRYNNHEAELLIDRYVELRGDVMVVLSPMPLLKQLVELGERPLRPSFRPCRDGEPHDLLSRQTDGTVVAKRFVGFTQTLEFHISEELL